MNIAILVPNFVEFDGGAQVARIQAEELAEEGNYVAVFTFAADMEPKNANLFVMGMPRSLFWQRVYRLLFPLDIVKVIKWLLKLKNFDQAIVHLYPLTWLAYLAKQFYKVKYTFWYDGIMDPKLFPYLYERIYIRAQIFLTKLTVRNADHAVSISKFAQLELEKYTGLDSEVIYCKSDTKRFHRGIDGTRIREKYNLANAPVILSVGTIRPVKGFHLLIQAFNLVKQEVPHAKLVIIGKHTYGYYLKQLKNLSDNSVVFIDYVPNKELPHYYAMCDLYATCSLWETFNLPLAEAQACGKSVVAFNMGPHPEVVHKNATLVETWDIEQFAQVCIEKLKAR